MYVFCPFLVFTHTQSEAVISLESFNEIITLIFFPQADFCFFWDTSANISSAETSAIYTRSSSLYCDNWLLETGEEGSSLRTCCFIDLFIFNNIFQQ